MRGFIITTVLFILMLTGIIINYNYVNTIYNDMNVMVSEISAAPSQENITLIENMQKYWESKKTLLSISVSFRDIDELTNILDTLYAANISDNATQFKVNIELLKNAIDAIMRLEKISINNILKRDMRGISLFSITSNNLKLSYFELFSTSSGL